LLAPAATPLAIQEKLNSAVNKIITHKDVKERLMALGMDSPPWNLEAFNKAFLADRDLMTKIVKETGITRES
jgi:tripartite-type tricarboxylate transporter receptor subunit TctC